MLLAYIDCYAGLSGETLLDALVSAGLSREQVDRALAGLPGKVTHTDEQRALLRLDSFRKSVAASSLSPIVKQAAGAVLAKLIEATNATYSEEADTILRAMGWHEWRESELRAAVGAVQALALLRIDRVECSPLRVGGGLVAGSQKQIRTPSPALSPVTATLLCGAAVPVYGSEHDSELVTPVGAALVTTLASAFGPLPPMTIRAIGDGREQAGKNGSIRTTRHTRLFIGESASVFVGPAIPHREASPRAEIKVEATPPPPQPGDTPTEATRETAADADEVDEFTTQYAAEHAPATPYISLVEEWVSLSIKGHQQSGRQRV